MESPYFTLAELRDTIRFVTKTLVHKGYRVATCRFQVDTDRDEGETSCCFYVHWSWYDLANDYASDTIFLYQDVGGPETVLNVARDWADNLLTVEGANARDFTRALAKTLELGKKLDIPEADLEKLRAMFQGISENLLPRV